MYLQPTEYYIYDGTFEGLLTAFDQALQTGAELEGIATAEVAKPGLFAEVVPIESDPDVAHAFFQGLLKRFTKEIAWDLSCCFMSELEGVELLLLNYLKLLQAKGSSFSQNHADPVVFKVQRLRHQVSHEVRRYHGFLRFRKLRNGLYYGAIEPDYNIIQFLSPHFKARFPDQPWLIHDLRRGLGVLYQGGRCRFISNLTDDEIISKFQNPPFDHQGTGFAEAEADYQTLWQEYFHNIAIEGRNRQKLQRQCMPVRYWKHLVESPDSLELG